MKITVNNAPTKVTYSTNVAQRVDLIIDLAGDFIKQFEVVDSSGRPYNMTGGVLNFSAWYTESGVRYSYAALSTEDTPGTSYVSFPKQSQGVVGLKLGSDVRLALSIPKTFFYNVLFITDTDTIQIMSGRIKVSSVEAVQ